MLALDRIRTKQTSLRRRVALAAAAVLSLTYRPPFMGQPRGFDVGW